MEAGETSDHAHWPQGSLSPAWSGQGVHKSKVPLRLFTQLCPCTTLVFTLSGSSVFFPRWDVHRHSVHWESLPTATQPSSGWDHTLFIHPIALTWRLAHTAGLAPCPHIHDGRPGPVAATLDHLASTIWFLFQGLEERGPSFGFGSLSETDQLSCIQGGCCLLSAQLRHATMWRVHPAGVLGLSSLLCLPTPMVALCLLFSHWGIALLTRHVTHRVCQRHLVTDSGLDAFSQYPSHGSFATPVYRLTAETRGAT